MRDRIPAAFFRLFALGAAGTLLWVCLRVGDLAASVGIGRLRDFELLMALGKRAVWWSGVPRSERLTWLTWLHEPHALWTGAERLGFTATALALHLGLVVALALALAPLLAWAIRGRRPGETRWALISRTLSVVAAAGVFLLALVGSGLEPERRTEAARPNVLLVSVDTLRADHLGSYGYSRDTSPHIDRIAQEGARFESVVSPSSWTLPSHVTLLTGLAPVTHGVNQPLGLRLDPDVKTLPELLWSEGYETAAFVAGGYVAAEYGHLQGFEHYDDYSVTELCRREGAGYRDCSTNANLVGLVDAHLGAWDASGRERPFFVFLHLWDVHNDYLPPEPYDRAFAPGASLPFNAGDIIDGSVDAAALTQEQRESLVGLYDGEIRHTDDWIGRLVERLEALGVLDDTVLVVTSDHGEELGDRGRWGHHEALYDESVLVPWVLRFPPKVPAGTVVTEQAKLADVAPTLLSLLDIEPRRLFGRWPLEEGRARDLSPLLGAAASPSTLLEDEAPAFGDLRGELSSVRTEHWKLIRDERTGSVELYDLFADPGEGTDVAAAQPEVTLRLSRRLAAWRHTTDVAAGRRQALRQSDEHLEQLRVLGYVE